MGRILIESRRNRRERACFQYGAPYGIVQRGNAACLQNSRIANAPSRIRSKDAMTMGAVWTRASTSPVCHFWATNCWICWAYRQSASQAWCWLRYRCALNPAWPRTMDSTLAGLAWRKPDSVDLFERAEFLLFASDVGRRFFFILSATAFGETFSSFSRSTGLDGCCGPAIRCHSRQDLVVRNAAVESTSRPRFRWRRHRRLGRRKNRDASSPNHRCPSHLAALHAKSARP